MNKYMRLVLLMLIDSILVILSVYIAYLLRFDFSIKPEFIQTLPYVFTMTVILVLTGFYLFKIYKRIWQYASIGDLFAILKGTFVGIGGFFALHHMIIHGNFNQIIVPRSIYLLVLLLSFISIGGSRLVWRLIRGSYTRMLPHHRRALIIGAGEAGVMVVKELRQTRSELYPVVFIDDNIQKLNYEVMGIPVVGRRDDIPRIVKQYNIDDIIVAIPAATRSDVSEIIKISKKTGCQIKIVPRVNDLINGKITIKMIRDVSIEDLLGREPVKVDIEGIMGYLNDQIVLITGAGGSIGSEICRQIAAIHPKQIILLGHGENSIYEIELELRNAYPLLEIEPVIADVQLKSQIDQIFRKYRPQVIFHTAAHKHVPLMERNPLAAVKNNVLGTKNLVECANKYQAKRFVLVSTDKAVNPTSVMGATKRIAEMILQNHSINSDTIFTAVRFGNVLGSRGSVIPIFRKQIEIGGPVTVTHPEMIRYFMMIPEAVQLVIQAGALATGGEIFILDMGQPVKIAELAQDLIRLSGLELDKDIEIVYTGLRPGEKLFEEILTNEEGAATTKHDRIFVSHPSNVVNEHFRNKLDELLNVIKRDEMIEPLELKQMLKQIVPNYSIYESQDSLNKINVDEQIRASLEMVAALEGK